MFLRLKKIYNNLKYEGNEKLSKLSILFIFILNIFVFTIINYGIDFQTKILNNPNTVYPSNCRQAIKNPDKFFNTNTYLYRNNNYVSKYNNISKSQLNPICKEVFVKINTVKNKTEISDINKYIKKEKSKLKAINKELNFIQANYNTELFEKIAYQNTSKNIKLMGTKYKQLLKNKNIILNNITNKKKVFKNNKFVLSLNQYAKDSKNILALYKQEMKNYKINKRLIALVFLLPLLLLFIYLSRKFLLKQKYIPHIISKNLMIITLIPFLYNAGFIIYDYIPHVFISKLINFFYSIDIPFVVYYILIAIAIIIVYFIIIKIQQNEKKKREETKDNELSFHINFNKSICNSCENKVDYLNMNFCPHCSQILKKECKECKKLTFTSLKYCFNCGCTQNESKSD